MARGDIASLGVPPLIISVVEDGTVAIVKGDLCILRVGKVKKITAITDPGKYVVAVEAIAKSGTGRVIVEGVVEMDEGNDGAVTLGDILIPSGSTLGDVKKGTTTQNSATYVQAEQKEPRLIVGMALEDIAKNATGKVLLGTHAGISD